MSSINSNPSFVKPVMDLREVGLDARSGSWEEECSLVVLGWDAGCVVGVHERCKEPTLRDSSRNKTGWGVRGAMLDMKGVVCEVGLYN